MRIKCEIFILSYLDIVESFKFKLNCGKWFNLSVEVVFPLKVWISRKSGFWTFAPPSDEEVEKATVKLQRRKILWFLAFGELLCKVVLRVGLICQSFVIRGL